MLSVKVEKGAELTEEIGKMKKAEEESKARTLKYLSISKKISDIRINILFGLRSEEAKSGTLRRS